MNPTLEQLQDVAGKLQAGMNPDPRVQEELVGWLQSHAGNGVFNKCLLEVGAAREGVAVGSRQIALLQLKGNIERHYKEAIEGMLGDVKTSLVGILSTPTDHPITMAASSCVASLVRVQGIAVWPDVMTHLWPLTTNPPIMLCIRQITEDNAAQLDDAAHQGDALCQNLLNFIGTNHALQDAALVQATQEALRAVGSLLDSESLVLPTSVIDKYVVGQLSQILQLLNTTVTRREYLPEVIRLYRMLLSYYNEMLKMKPGFGEILPTVFAAAKSPDETVCMEACEYWNEFCAIRTLVKSISSTQGTLANLLEVLMANMLYSEMEVTMLDEAETKDDIKPFTGRGTGGEEEEVDQWTARKASASAVDHLAAVLRDEVLTPMGTPQNWLLSEIQNRLQSQDWRMQECGVLLLGALSEGAYNSFTPLLPGLVPQLLAMAESPHTHYLVVSITCWTLSRFEYFITTAPDPTLFPRYAKTLLDCMGSSKRRVQEMATSSFASLVERNTPKLVAGGLVGPVVEKLAQLVAPGRYTARNLSILLDGIGALVMGAREEVNNQRTHEVLFMPVVAMLQTVNEDAPTLPRLLLTLRYMCQGLGPAFVPYLQPTYGFLQGVISNYYAALHAGPASRPEWNHAQFAFSFVTTLVHELPGQMKSLVTAQTPSGATLLDLALMAATKPQLNIDRPVIGSSFELLAECVRQYSDIAASVIQQAEGCLSLVPHDDPASVAVMEFIREVVYAGKVLNADCRGAAVKVAQTMVGVVVERRMADVAVRGAALLVGVCGLVVPDQLGDIRGFIEGVGWHLGREQEGRGKEVAFQGFLEILNANFSACSDAAPIVAFGSAVAGLRTRPGTLVPPITAFLARLKDFTGPQWTAATSLLPPDFPPDIMCNVDPTLAATPPPPSAPPPPC